MNVLAAIDIGTHSVRVVVVEIHPDGSWTTLDQSKEYVRLGEGEFVGGRKRLTQEALDRCTRVCARFGDIAKGFGATEVIALATSAAREAANQDELVEQVRKASGGFVEIRVISGHEEARLIYLGVMSGLDLPESERALLMDIGGGSTELIVGDKQRYAFLDSLKMGAIRLTGEVIPKQTKPITAEQWQLLQKTVRSTVEPASRAIKREGFTRMIGSSGTVMALAEIAARRRAATSINPTSTPSTMRDYELHLSEVQEIAQILNKLPLDQRKKVPGLAPERADIIIAGAAIVQTVMETVGANSIFISERGLREGIVVDYLLREAASRGTDMPAADQPVIRELSVRERSTGRLARRTQIDEDHARHVIALAQSMFDQTRDLGLHDLGLDAREMLAYGALLHDSGFFVSHTGHHQHSYYLIRNSEMLGFNDTETEVIALIALYHRKGLPKQKNAAYAALPPYEQEMVRVLSCLVRVAEALDRSHLGLVTGVTLTRPKKSGPVIMAMQFKPNADPALEIWAALAQQEPFKKTFDVDLDVTTPEQTLAA